MSGPASALAVQAYSRDRATGRVLPRPEDVFSASAFGPMAPTVPYPIDTPNKTTGAADPRIWQYPMGWNMGTPPRSFEPVSFGTLRNLARVVDIVRIAIQTLKNHIATAEWGIRVKDERDAFKTKGREYLMDEKKEVKRFFEVPDRPNDYEWADWIGMLVEEVMVTDALTIYPTATVIKGKGPLGSSLAALTILDGTTVKPLLDTRGGRPRPPAPAFQQFLYGVPRSEFVSAQDFVELDKDANESFSSAELIYKPFNPRPESPWGFPPTEWAIVNTITYMRRALWWQSYFTESNLPAGFVFGAEGWTPDELERYERQINAMMSGDPAWQFKLKYIPHGGNYQPVKETTFDVTFDEYMLHLLLMPFGVTPMEVGLMPKSGLGGKGMAEGQKEAGDRRGIDPHLRKIASLCTRLIERYFKQPELEFYFLELDTEDKSAKATIDTAYVNMGVRTRNEVRDENGWDPSEEPMADELTITTAQGITPLDQFDPKVVADKAQLAADQAAQGALQQADQSHVQSMQAGDKQHAQALEMGDKQHEQALEMADKTHENTVEETVVSEKEKAKNAPPRPAPAAKKVAEMRELEVFDRFASKPQKRPFSFKYVAPDWAGRLNAALNKDAKEDARVKALQAALALKIEDAADRLDDDAEEEFDEESFVDDVLDALRAQLFAALLLGTSATLGLLTPRQRELRAKATTEAERMAESQRAYLEDFAEAIKQGRIKANEAAKEERRKAKQDAADEANKPDEEAKPIAAVDDEAEPTDETTTPTDKTKPEVPAKRDPIAARAELYTGIVWSAYQRGLVSRAPEGAEFIWHAVGDKDTCDACEKLDGQTFTEETLPFWPGESDFGDDDDTCHGGPNCRCTLEEVVKADEGDDQEDIAAGATADLHKVTLSDLLKYSPDQDRDEHGRWTTGAGGNVAATMERPTREAESPVRSAMEAVTIDAATAFGQKHGVEMFTGALPDRQQQEVVATLEKLTADYPEVTSSLANVSAAPMRDPSVVASTIETRSNGKDSLIQINPSGLNRVMASYNKDVEGGYFAKTNASPTEYIMTHEFGHAMAIKFFHDDPQGSNKLWDRIERGQPVSQYGKASSAEAFAEAFAAMRLGGVRYADHPHVQVVRESIEAMRHK